VRDRFFSSRLSIAAERCSLTCAPRPRDARSFLRARLYLVGVIAYDGGGNRASAWAKSGIMGFHRANPKRARGQMGTEH
jgi:hypothetical protein